MEPLGPLEKLLGSYNNTNNLTQEVMWYRSTTIVWLSPQKNYYFRVIPTTWSLSHKEFLRLVTHNGILVGVLLLSKHYYTEGIKKLVKFQETIFSTTYSIEARVCHILKKKESQKL